MSCSPGGRGSFEVGSNLHTVKSRWKGEEEDPGDATRTLTEVWRAQVNGMTLKRGTRLQR